MGTKQVPEANTGVPPTTEKPKTWTVLLYIEADGALANFAVESLKQLEKSISKNLDEHGKPRLGVAAQFAFPLDAANAKSATAEASGEETRRRFVFKTVTRRNLAAHQVPFPPAPKNAAMSGKANVPGKANGSEAEALKEFLTSVHTNPDLKADHYALILWGHGPELLLQPGTGNPSDSRETMYITPKQLREALEVWKYLEGRPLEIVGFDACFMSMFEMAYELKDRAKYMVASQEEVPDQSFPYDTLIDLFLAHGADTASLLKDGVDEYVRTYQEYIFDQDTGLKPVTLSALSLDNGDVLKDAVRSLACALLNAQKVERLYDLLVEARKSSQDYAGGLYVDLYDFCTKLLWQLHDPSDNDARKAAIRTACKNVRDALTISSDGKSFVLVNRSVIYSGDGKKQRISIDSDNTTSHGVSIYLPYLTEEQFNKVNRPLVKGGHGTGGAKGFSGMLNGAATEYLMCARRELILATESYYDRLEMADATNWYSFITEVWTRALIDTDPVNLDFHYSAQQSWVNRFRDPIVIAEKCKEP